uniref:Signal transducer and activator of transcription n=1 Tax=Saccoglossus kowalevskii TaxID=10224 RepID=A0ABM0M4K2_SACKO|nr:PREDICTED: signal transducer and activator of transcription 5B isoform X3 [Saccoglossus kowalevskii]
MALWARSQQLQGEQLKQMQALYGPHFPIEIRHHCADWLESQQWHDYDMTNPAHEQHAKQCLEQLLACVRQKSTDSVDFVTNMRLNEIYLQVKQQYDANPLNLVRIIQHCLDTERELVQSTENEGHQSEGMQENSQTDLYRQLDCTFQRLYQMTQETEADLQNMKQKQELFVFQYQTSLKLQNQLKQLQQYPQNDPNRQAREKQLMAERKEVDTNLQLEAQQLLQNRIDLAEKHQQTFKILEDLLNQTLEDQLVQWKRRQQLASIGGPPEGSLEQIQQWCENLADLIWQNRQQIKNIDLLRQQLPMKCPGSDLLPQLHNTITSLLSTLVTSTFIIDKQPPQVLKKDTKFSAGVRLLVGGKLSVHMSPPTVKASIISENQAKALLHNENANVNDTSGDILNNCGVMEYLKDSGVLSVNFRNMSLKKIKREEGRGQEIVTEKKFTILFQSEFSVAGQELVFQVRTLSLPVVVIVHGNQESNASATILWDNSFAEPGRIPFIVQEKVHWTRLSQALNRKFSQACGRQLTPQNLKYLAVKAFDGHSTPDMDFDNMMISWANFNRENLSGKQFTFWKWFHGIIEITKKHLREPWQEGYVVGFVSKGHAQELLLSRANGTFMLRYSDGSIGGVTIAWVAQDPNTGERQVWNLQPFTSEDFNIRSLADRILDLPQLVNLYPDIPKDLAFAKYTKKQPEVDTKTQDGYVPSGLVSTVQLPAAMMPMSPLAPRMYEEPASPAQSIINPGSVQSTASTDTTMADMNSAANAEIDLTELTVEDINALANISFTDDFNIEGAEEFDTIMAEDLDSFLSRVL